jgi:predicted Zn-dependent protease
MSFDLNRPLALTRIARGAIFCIALGACGAAFSQNDGAAAGRAGLPNLGDGADMAPSAERRIGDRIARELYRDPDYLDDSIILDYVQDIWLPLMAAARLRGELPAELDSTYAWEILLGRDRSVNAFALPGGYLGLHLGLVGVVSSRDELASVLAHELSHVTQRHISRLISRQSGQAPWLMGAMILGAMAASKSADAGTALLVGGQAVAAQNQLNFSRDMEREADRVGFGVMTQAGFEPKAFVSMFEKLQRASRLNDGGGFPYLRSHPLNTERMADMQARATQATGETSPSVHALEHAMVAARARVLANGNVDALRAALQHAQPARLAKLTPLERVAALYESTFAALKLRDFSAAQAYWNQLAALAAKDTAGDRTARLLGAELALAQNQPQQALTLLKGLGKANRSVLLWTAKAQLQASQPALASQDLQTWLADHPRDAQAWQLLASANAAQGKTLASVRAEAEVNIAQLDFAAALTRLKAAQDFARKGAGSNDHIEASIVDTRTRQVELWVRDLALER